MFVFKNSDEPATQIKFEFYKSNKPAAMFDMIMNFKNLNKPAAKNDKI